MTSKILEKIKPLEVDPNETYLQATGRRAQMENKLREALKVAVEALEEVVRMDGIMGCETVDESKNALAEIESIVCSGEGS